jgi:UDP-glucose 4-epimerase
MPGRPQEVKNANCSADKIRKFFNYKTKKTQIEAIQSMIKYIEKRGVRKFTYHLPVEIISNKTPKTWTEKIF